MSWTLVLHVAKFWTYSQAGSGRWGVSLGCNLLYAAVLSDIFWKDYWNRAGCQRISLQNLAIHHKCPLCISLCKSIEKDRSSTRKRETPCHNSDPELIDIDTFIGLHMHWLKQSPPNLGHPSITSGLLSTGPWDLKTACCRKLVAKWDLGHWLDYGSWRGNMWRSFRAQGPGKPRWSPTNEPILNHTLSPMHNAHCSV